MILHLAHFLPRSRVNGPGERAVVWVQGCPFRCPGCFNADLQPFAGGREVSIGEAFDWIMQEHRRAPLAGITFSGGEPMAQAAALASLARMVHAEGMNVVTFTGYDGPLLVYVPSDDPMRDLLDETDLLITGPYLQEECLEGSDMRGSGNQEIVYLTGRIGLPERISTQAEIIVDPSGQIFLTGYPDEELKGLLGEISGIPENLQKGKHETRTHA